MKRPKVTGLRRRESWQALPFLLPSLLGLCLFYLFPLAETVRASFMDPLRSRAVGWGNYRALFQNTAFRLAVRNTCRFLCICIPALLAVSLLCAVLLGAAKRRAVFFKSVLLLPMRSLLPASLCYGGRFSPARGWSTACWWGWGAGPWTLWAAARPFGC